VTLLDAFALIAFLGGGPAAPQVRAILREGDAGVATANLVETLDITRRAHGVPIPRTMEILEPLLGDALTAVVLDTTIARRAAELRARHYHRSSRPISLADAVLLASATDGDTIATADPDVLAVAREEALETVELPGLG
jgi:hypothetical protein